MPSASALSFREYNGAAKGAPPRHEEAALSPAITDARDFNLILGGTEAGHVTWAPQALERAKDTGLAPDAEGNLLTGGRK